MTASAQPRAWRAQGSRTSVVAFCAGVAACCAGAPASAEVGATASVFSDARVRGYSLSERRPVAIFDFAYDDPSGFYVGASALGVLRHGGRPAPLGVQVSGGYAKRLGSGTALDVGLIHASYSHYSGLDRGSTYTELYAGIARGPLSSRIFLSPDYFERGRWTAYGEVNGSVSPARKWSLDAHAGMLVTLGSPAHESYRTDFDWRIGVTRELGRVSLHLAWSDGAPGRDDYAKRGHSRSALVVGASWLF